MCVELGFLITLYTVGTYRSVVTVKSCVDWLSNNGAAYALLPLASQAVGGRVKNVRVLFSDPSLTMSAAIAQKMYRELEEKWRNAEIWSNVPPSPVRGIAVREEPQPPAAIHTRSARRDRRSR